MLLAASIDYQIVGRERNQVACHRQLVRDVAVSRRINSSVRFLPEMDLIKREMIETRAERRSRARVLTAALAVAIFMHFAAGKFDTGHIVFQPGGHLSILAMVSIDR